jgi:hypothetical protein
MRSIWVLAGVMAVAGSGSAAETCTVGVRIHNLVTAPPGALFRAKSLAGEMFGRIGVELQWQGGGTGDTGRACWPPIEIYLEGGSPGADRPDSMAYAMPYLEGGTRIHVFVDRVAAMVPAGRVGTLLGHVLVHEITHGLEGISRHSPRGVMKAHWDTPDFRAMEVHPLPFDEQDVILIHAAAKRTPASGSLTPTSE